MNEIIEKMKNEFDRRFGGGGEIFAVRAPGRVNLIGEHTDYNDGFVLPMALEHAVFMLGRPAAGTAGRLYSLNFETGYEYDMGKDLGAGVSKGWGRYAEGVARVLSERTGRAVCGVDAVLWGDVPLGSGLSSSAALEVAVGYFYTRACGIDVSFPQLALFCQEAENRYVGVQCGIMDQFVSCLGKAGNAVFLDCRSLEYEYVPVRLDNHALLILNTGVPRGLAGSAYNARRRACEEGVAAIRKQRPDVKALRDVSADEFETKAYLMPEDTARKCRHVVTENARVINSVEALRRGDMARFGKLMNESHRSLRVDYEVTCPELDLLHDAAREMKGVVGERMTGAGFGGCAVALVEKAAADDVQAALVEIYKKKTGIYLEVYRSAAMQGVGMVEI